MRRTLALAVFAAVLGAGPAATAAPPSPVPDCNLHGKLTHRYTVAQLRRGLSTMPTYVKEYTDCYDVIQRTLLTQAASRRTDAGSVGVSRSGESLLPAPLIAALALLALAAAIFGLLAIRRRHGGS
jgi:hypothetical protein